MNALVEALRARSTRADRGIRFGSAEAALVSYEEMWGRVALQAGHLGRSLARGERVLLVGDNSQSQVEALLACWWAGLTPICVPPPARLSPGQVYRQSLQNWVELSGARAGWAEPEIRDRCAEVDLPSGWHRFPVGGDTPLAPQEGGEIAYIQFSSGTTLHPKAVTLTPGNLIHNTRAILSVFPQPLEQHSCVSWLPLYHDMGLVGSLLSALVAGGDLVLMRPYQFAARPLSWLQALSHSRATVSPAPNFALLQSLERIRQEDLANLDLSHWQLALLGSETIHAATLRAFFEKFRCCGLRWESLTPVYGLAEATLAVTFSPPGRGPKTFTYHNRELVSLGPPLPGIEVKIVDDLGQPTPPTVPGRVLTRSASVMKGYLGQPSDLPEGWLDTGDLGFFQEEELYLTGRAKDVLIVRGQNYDPEALEQALLEVDGLDPGRAAAIALPDDVGIVLLAERKRKETLPGEKMVDAARSAVARRTGLLVEVKLVEAGWLPRTTSGKVKRGAARQRHLEESP